MSKIADILKPFIPILATAYSLALIFVTALPSYGENSGFGAELLSWLLTIACIGLTIFLVTRVEPKIYPSSQRFSLKFPELTIIAGLLLIAPLWTIAKEFVVYGITSLSQSVQLEPMVYTTAEIREDLTASVHAVLLAPLLEELCFRQMAISPFKSRKSRIIVCLVMALLFGLLHIRNFPGAFTDAVIFGLIFIWTKNIWCSVALHAGCNLTSTIFAVLCWLGLGNFQMTRTPVIILPDTLFIICSTVLAIMGALLILKRKQCIFRALKYEKHY